MLVALMLTPNAGVRAQFSPGKLSRAHAALEGATQCFKCHEPRKATTATRCFECHRPLQTRLAAGAGYHATLAEARQGRCSRCHAEHGGAENTLIRWPGGRDAFEHRHTGFALDGKHAGLRCDACHKPALVRADDVRRAAHLALERTYLGLSRRCADCHADAHHGQFATDDRGSDCTRCHSTAAWKPASRFDHAATRFSLEGKHTGVACSLCHHAESESGAKVASETAGAFRRYKPMSLDCSGCHTDVHKNRFGSDCRRCHSAAGWKELALGSFDHGRTRFPLEGEHLRVACSRCHWSENAAGKKVEPGATGARLHWKPIASQQCSDCHKDPHRQRFGPECARCHAPAGWTVITAGAFDHDRTSYPLRGRHRQTACVQCHDQGKTSKSLPFGACVDCHADAHQGQLARRTDGGACESCHAVEGFLPVRFGVQEHGSTRFPLQEAHRAVPCSACHKPTAPLQPASKSKALVTTRSDVMLRFEDPSCAGCHDDPHAGQFGAGKQTDCKRCHSQVSWRIDRFDHDSTRFRLDGAHARTPCSSCHRAAGDRVVRYRPLDRACRACHAEKG